MKTVKCIDASKSHGYLEEGKIYEVEEEHIYYYVLNDKTSWNWLKERFEVVENFTPFKVRCIDDTSSNSLLKKDEIYIVEHEKDSCYMIYNNDVIY